jgi:hypothetical protein
MQNPQRMKKYLLAIIFTAFINFAFGQTEKITNKLVGDSFEINFNSENYDAIFLSFSKEMKIALLLDKTKEFLEDLKTQVGKITKRQFIKYEQRYASYKTNFERGLFAVNISIDNNSNINGLFVKPYKESNLPKIERNTTKLILPFKDEWTITWGGDTKELNYHIESEAQKNAFDIVITDKNDKSYKTDGKSNEDYYAFGKELIAPCDGEIVLVVDGVKDNIPGISNPIYIPGNSGYFKNTKQRVFIFCSFQTTINCG